MARLYCEICDKTIEEECGYTTPQAAICAECLQFPPRTQIAYIPTHADGDINHPDVEFGFVTNRRKDTIFCRYWRKGQPGELRTKANSEGTPIDMLVLHDSVSARLVDEAWRDYVEGS